jgi:hypothetical protein
MLRGVTLEFACSSVLMILARVYIVHESQVNGAQVKKVLNHV